VVDDFVDHIGSRVSFHPFPLIPTPTDNLTNKQKANPDRLLDSIHISYVNTITGIIGNQFTGTALNLSIEKIEVHGIQEVVSPLPERITEAFEMPLFDKKDSRLACFDVSVNKIAFQMTQATLSLIERPKHMRATAPHLNPEDLSHIPVESKIEGKISSSVMVIRYQKSQPPTKGNLHLRATSFHGSSENLDLSSNLESIPPRRLKEKLHGDRISTASLPVILQLDLGSIGLKWRLQTTSKADRAKLFHHAALTTLALPEREKELPPQVPFSLNASLDISSANLDMLAQPFEVCLGMVATWELFGTKLSQTLVPLLKLPLAQQRLLLTELAQLSTRGTSPLSPPSLAPSIASARPSVMPSGREDGDHPRGVDPPFLTQPSKMWRLGERPFQNDDGWKLLSHLRYTMDHAPDSWKKIIEQLDHLKLVLFSSYLGQEGGGSLTQPFPPRQRSEEAEELFDPDQLLKTVLDSLWHWRHWERDDLARCSLLVDLYDQPRLEKICTFANTILAASSNFYANLVGLNVTIYSPHHEENVLSLFAVRLLGNSQAVPSEKVGQQAGSDEGLANSGSRNLKGSSKDPSIGQEQGKEGRNGESSPEPEGEEKVLHRMVRVQAFASLEGISVKTAPDLFPTLEALLRSLNTFMAIEAAFRFQESESVRKYLKRRKKKQAGSVPDLRTKSRDFSKELGDADPAPRSGDLNSSGMDPSSIPDFYSRPSTDFQNEESGLLEEESDRLPLGKGAKGEGQGKGKGRSEGGERGSGPEGASGGDPERGLRRKSSTRVPLSALRSTSKTFHDLVFPRTSSWRKDEYQAVPSGIRRGLKRCGDVTDQALLPFQPR